MPQYKLIHFNIKGRAETVRVIFALAGVPYEDYRLKEGEWPTLKPKMPMGQVPVLEVDGKMLGQSMAICRYLAKQFGLTGQNDWEDALCDMLGDSATDCLSRFRSWIHEKDEEKKKQVLEGIKNDQIAPFTERCEKILAVNESGFYVGSKLTWIDLYMFTMEEDWQGLFSDVMESRPNMKEHFAKICSLPNIKKWVETRPQTAM